MEPTTETKPVKFRRKPYRIKSVQTSINTPVPPPEKYDFRFEPNGFAIIFLDQATGRISMQTDWGDFSSGWSSPGRSLKEFLATNSPDYFMRNFCSRDYFDFDASKKELRKLVNEAFKNNDLTVPEKIEICQEIADWNDPETPDQYMLGIERALPLAWEKVLQHVDYPYIPCVVDYRPVHIRFFEKIWPQIQKHWAKELGLKPRKKGMY